MDKNINDAGSADNTEKPCHPRFARLKSTLRRWEFWVGILSIILTLFLAVSVVAFWEQFQARPNLGYTGLFFVCLMGGATVIIPVPSIAVQFAMGAVLNPLVVGIISGIGSAVGGTLIFLFGRGGRRLFSNVDFSYLDSDKAVVRWTGRIMHWARNRGSMAVFLMSAIFNPVFFPMAMAIGTSKYKLWKFFVMCSAGNIVKSLFVAYLGYFGLGSILKAIGIDI
ncbi:MAG: VTT domain-containing protein [Dehalococcoidales bacterium]|nr:VTT domain-containing protein [Dehalococcoidales bacterium]